MPTMRIIIPDEMSLFVEEQVANSGYASASDYVRDLVNEARRHKAKAELDTKLFEGLQGLTTEMTRREWDSIEQKALSGLSIGMFPKWKAQS